MQKFYWLVLLSLLVTPAYAQYENPKVDFNPSQTIIDGDALNLHILPNIIPEEKLKQLKLWIESMHDKVYQDFDNRIGVSWDDYWLDRKTDTVRIDPVAKFVTIDGTDVEQKPASIFNYSDISKILLKDLLPRYFEHVAQHIALPDTVYLQTFVLRSVLTDIEKNKTQLVRWHQDPSEYGTIGDYTLVLMLSDHTNPTEGWDGGELLIKNGLPADQTPAIKITPRHNQAIMFNNKLNSHMVTNIQHRNKGVRDVVIINLYLEDPTCSLKIPVDTNPEVA